MRSVCSVHYVPFQGLLEAEEYSCEDISDEMQALMCSPPPNTHLIVKLSNSEHYRQSRKDMSNFVQFFLK